MKKGKSKGTLYKAAKVSLRRFKKEVAAARISNMNETTPLSKPKTERPRVAQD